MGGCGEGSVEFKAMETKCTLALALTRNLIFFLVSLGLANVPSGEMTCQIKKKRILTNPTQSEE